MYKKNSWIVALLAALSFSIFLIGCVEPLAEVPKDEGNYREFELTEFNAWGGNAENQQGWGSDGAKWDNGKKTVKSIGLSVEDLQMARYLVVEVNDGFPKNNFETIWSSWDADGEPIGDWQQFSNITSAGGELNPGFGTREGNVLKLEMAKILKNYSTFMDSSTASITLLIQHWGNGGVGACIKSAKLLISDEPLPFVAVTDITLTTTGGAMTMDINLGVATVTPTDATLQRIIWSIVGFLPEAETDTADNWLTVSAANYDSDKAALLAKVDFKKSGAMDYSVYPAQATGRSPNIIIATEPGKVKVKAIILGGAVEGGDDFIKDFTITVVEKIPYTVPAAGGGYFYVDLNEWDTQTPEGTNINSHVPLAKTNTDKITVPFTENAQRVNFKLTDEQVALLFAATPSVVVDIQGTITVDGTPSGDSFRYHIGDAISGENWNATNAPLSGQGDPWAGQTGGPQTLTFNANKSELTCGYLILQHRNANAITVEITSIKITYGFVVVDVDGTPQNLTVKASGNNPPGVSLVTGGYEVAFVNNYGNSFAIFEVDFGTDTLADFSKIEFGYQGISGDVGWKDILVFAYAAEKTGYLDSGAAADRIVSVNYANDGKTLIPVSATIGANTISTNKVWFIITIHADETPVFQITDIKFVK